MKIALLASVCFVGISWCSCNKHTQVHKRTLADARSVVIDIFSKLDDFELVKQRELTLASCPAICMEGTWTHTDGKRYVIIYVVENNLLFNVIYYTTPSDSGLFEAGYPAFGLILKKLRVINHLGPLTVLEKSNEKVMRSGELQLEIHFPHTWVYVLDNVNRAVIFSGPRENTSWLTTVTFSVVNKWKQVK
jgi:hypothetical protein